jgi:hypothetical protein
LVKLAQAQQTNGCGPVSYIQGAWTQGRSMTYVDASSLALLHSKGIREVWGTDRDLAPDGARVLPVSS